MSNKFEEEPKLKDEKAKELLRQLGDTAYYDALEHWINKNIDWLKEVAVNEEDDISKVIGCKKAIIALKGIKNFIGKPDSEKRSSFGRYREEFRS